MPGTACYVLGITASKDPEMVPASESLPCSGGETLLKCEFVFRVGEMVMLSIKNRKRPLGQGQVS